jgi:hypothetical protein
MVPVLNVDLLVSHGTAFDVRVLRDRARVARLTDSSRFGFVVSSLRD